MWLLSRVYIRALFVQGRFCKKWAAVGQQLDYKAQGTIFMKYDHGRLEQSSVMEHFLSMVKQQLHRWSIFKYTLKLSRCNFFPGWWLPMLLPISCSLWAQIGSLKLEVVIWSDNELRRECSDAQGLIQPRPLIPGLLISRFVPLGLAQASKGNIGLASNQKWGSFPNQAVYVWYAPLPYI